MKNLLRFNSALIVLILFSAVAINSQNRGLSPDDLFKIKNVGETLFSPDGKMIAYTLNVPRPLNEEPGNNFNQLFVYNIQEN